MCFLTDPSLEGKICLRFLTDPSLEAAGKVIATIGHARDDRGKVRLTLKFSVNINVDDDDIDDDGDDGEEEDYGDDGVGHARYNRREVRLILVQ